LSEYHERYAKRYKSKPPLDGHLWIGRHEDDLLMWSQRKVLDEWFSGYLNDLRILGSQGRPWDKDHIVPYDFFNHASYNEEDVQEALKERYQVESTEGLDWNNFRHFWRNSTGNYRIWPSGLNRSDQDKAAISKLTDNSFFRDYEEHLVLSNWIRNMADKPISELRLASAINGNELWDKTPNDKKSWNKVAMTSFMRSVSQREQALYHNLLEFVWPDRSESCNRLL
jgi:hypothetical protein